MMPTEAQVVRACLEYLNRRGHYVWRNNTGAIRTQYTNKRGTTKRYFWKAGVKGSSDLIGIAKDGKFLAVECKRPGKNPTLDQVSFLNEVSGRGAYAVVARCIEDLQEVGL